MQIFDGYTFAADKENQLKIRLAALKLAQPPTIAALLFTEDQGSQLYTRLKKEAAERIGIQYQLNLFSMMDPAEKALAVIQTANQNPEVTGIIIQKPWRQTWMAITGGDADDFKVWWHQLTSSLELAKDVDGLHPQTLLAIQNHTWRADGRVMPATAKAVISILTDNHQLEPESRVVILGKSDILGQPLAYELSNQGYSVDMIGSLELQARQAAGIGLTDADIVISSTGRHHLVTGSLVKEGVVVIDVGEPKPDVEFATVAPKARFITPVPGGVGPVTVVSLLENAVDLLM